MFSVSIDIRQLYQGLKLGVKQFTNGREAFNPQLQSEIAALRQKVAHLERQSEQLSTTNEQLTQELERTQQEKAELQAVNQDLTTRNKELKMFARTVAHDVKTPISIVVGMAEILKIEYHDALLNACERQDSVEECIDAIVKNARRTNDIIESILLFAHWERQEVQTDPLDMAGIVQEAQDRLEHMVQSYKAEIKAPDQWPLAVGYGPWIEEVWTNYMSNAIKYGGRPAQVQLGATPLDDGMVRFWVKDNGPGLSEEEQAKLFTPFTRLAKDTIEGSGLGLSIVKCIVNKLGGEVGIESRPDQGSEFYFTLPTINK